MSDFVLSASQLPVWCLFRSLGYPVDFEYLGQDVAVVDIKANSGEPILNELIYGNISGRKVDEAGEAVAGAVIGLFGADETEFTKENALMIDVSREDGAFGFENVVYGHWIVAEIEQPEGFILALEMHHVYVDSDGETIEIVMTNEHIKGNVLLTKFDADYPENKLTGAVFVVYLDVNGDGKPDDGDIFVADLAETEKGLYELKDLPYGKYLLLETVAPEGFEKDENAYPFEIRENGEAVAVENETGIGFFNRAQRGNLIIEKSSEDGVVEGFEFVVEGTDFLGNAFSETYVTDADGKINVSLRPGNYTVYEKESDGNMDIFFRSQDTEG